MEDGQSRGEDLKRGGRRVDDPLVAQIAGGEGEDNCFDDVVGWRTFTAYDCPSSVVQWYTTPKPPSATRARTRSCRLSMRMLRPRNGSPPGIPAADCTDASVFRRNSMLAVASDERRRPVGTALRLQLAPVATVCQPPRFVSPHREAVHPSIALLSGARTAKT